MAPLPLEEGGVTKPQATYGSAGLTAFVELESAIRACGELA